MGVIFIHFLGFVAVHVFCKPTEEQTVRLKIHHGGMLIYNPGCLFIIHLLCMSMVRSLKKNGVEMWILCRIFTS